MKVKQKGELDERLWKQMEIPGQVQVGEVPTAAGSPFRLPVVVTALTEEESM